MKIIVVRDTFTPVTTLGTVFLVLPGEDEEKHYAYSCEDVDRSLDQAMTPEEVRAVKVPCQTAIPTGTYRVAFTYSPHFERHTLEVLDVPGFRGIRIHPGNDESDTAGCLLFGLHRDPSSMTISASRAAVAWLEDYLRDHSSEPVTLEIRRAPGQNLT